MEVRCKPWPSRSKPRHVNQSGQAMLACGGDRRGDYRGACGGDCCGACCGAAVACCGACHWPRGLPRCADKVAVALDVRLAAGSRNAVFHGKFGMSWHAVASGRPYGMPYLTMGPLGNVQCLTFHGASWYSPWDAMVPNWRAMAPPWTPMAMPWPCEGSVTAAS